MELIAIDGLAGTGKSTLARALAERLGLDYLDTGATFRMMALAMLRSNVRLEDEDEIMRVVDSVDISYEKGKSMVNGVDVTDAIRDEKVSSAASKIAVHPRLRERLLNWQRSWVASHGASVVEGRDTTSAVFPDAAVKVYLEADAKVRAARRSEATVATIAERDKRDSERKVAPLIRVPEAVEIDTTRLSRSEVENLVIDLWERHRSKE
ncbi:MAG: (d)CMP kinase [Actinomycetota bacterium]|nr:(d)CMP kinase [Actinomycetota bacterium]